MAKQSFQQRRVQKRQQEQAIFRRVLYIFLTGFGLECYLLLMKRLYVDGTVDQVLGAHAALPWIIGAGAAAAVIGAVLSLLKKAPRWTRRTGNWVLGLGLFLAVSGVAMRQVYPEGATVLSVLVPILTIIGLIFYLYQHEFFVTAMILGGSIFSLWVCQRGLDTVNWNTKVTVGAAAVLAGLAAVAYVTRMIQKNDGKWISKPEVRIFSPGCSYPLLYLAYAAGFAAVALALAFTVTIYYAMWVLGLLLFALAVYYTSKLM